MHPTGLSILPKAVLLLMLALMTASLSCQSSNLAHNRSPEKATDLVWEAWDGIKESYVNVESLDSEEVVGNIIKNMVALVDGPPYPFLTEVGRLRGQPPGYVPPELADVWRALVLHRQKWPEFQESLLVQAAIAGMVEGIGDPSTGFIKAEDYAQAKESLAGSYQGIGADVRVVQDRILLFPRKDTPAEKAGVQAGDVLLAVEGEPVAGRRLSEVTDQVRGPAGTKVKLLVERAGEPGPLEYEVFRGNVEIPSTQFQLLPGGIGYIYIDEFKENTGDKVLETLEKLKRVDMLALILDLRSNPGGSIESARQVVSQFLPPGGLFMYEMDRAGQRKEWPILAEGLAVDKLPMVVLVNEETISVAEAVAGALQDADRAVIMGAPTFGKGSTNTFLELTDGSAIYLPTSRWYTPSGRILEGTGIEPDTQVPFESENRGFGERQINQAYDYLNSLLPPFR